MQSTVRDQRNLLVTLTANMKEMETELRAHSIVLEALTEGVIEPAQMGEALLWARCSTSMLEFMRKKYLPLEELASNNPDGTTVVLVPTQRKTQTYSH